MQKTRTCTLETYNYLLITFDNIIFPFSFVVVLKRLLMIITTEIRQNRKGNAQLNKTYLLKFLKPILSDIIFLLPCQKENLAKLQS